MAIALPFPVWGVAVLGAPPAPAGGLGVAAAGRVVALLDAGPVLLRGAGSTTAAGLVVRLPDVGVVRGVGVAAGAAVCVAALRGRVAAFCARLAVLTPDRHADRVAVEDLDVAGVGVAAVTAGGGTVAAGGAVVALGDVADVALIRQRQLRRCRHRPQGHGSDQRHQTREFSHRSRLSWLELFLACRADVGPPARPWLGT